MEKSKREFELEKRVLELEKIILNTKIVAIELNYVLENSILVTNNAREKIENIIKKCEI